MRPPVRVVFLWALGYLALVALASFPLLRADWPAVPMAPFVPGWLPGDGDPLYRLWWIDWLWSHPGVLFESGARTDVLFAPFGGQLALVQAQLFQGLLALALKPLGDPVLAYAVLWALSFLFTALATAALALDVSRSSSGAFLAGMLTAFGSAFFVHSLEHVFKYLGFAFVPLAFLALRRALERGGRRAFAAFFACSALIFLSDWYNALYVVLAGAVLWFHGFVVAREKRRVLLRRTGILAAQLPLLALVLWWTLAPVASREADTLAVPLSEQAQYGVDLLNLVLPHPYHPVFGRLTGARLHGLPGNVFEKTAFFGWLLPLVLAGLAWRARSERALRPWLLLFAVFLLLSFGPSLDWAGRPLLTLPGAWLGAVPGFAGSRAPGRYVVVATLAIGVLAALLVARERRPGLAAGALGLLALFELAPFAAPVVALAPSAALARLAAIPGTGAVLDVPFRHAVQRYVYDQTLHRRPLVGGYMVRFTPRYAAHPADLPGFGFLREPDSAPAPTDAPRLAFALTRLVGVEYLAVHKRFLADPGRVVERLLASGLPLRRVDEDDQVALLRLDARRVPSAGFETIEAGASAGGLLALGWSTGGTRPNGGTFLWSEGGEAAIALAPPPAASAVTLELMSYPAVVSGTAQGVEIHAGKSSRDVMLPAAWREVTVPLRASPGWPAVVRFTTAMCVRPVDVEPGRTDPRCLALGLGRVSWAGPP